MSVKIMGQVWELALKPAEKYVLLAYADHADHEGNNIRPSKELVAWKTGYKVRQVISITKKLVGYGLLEVVSNQPGKVIGYRTTLDNANKLPERKKKGVQSLHGAKNAVVQSTTLGGANATLNNPTEPSIEPSVITSKDVIAPSKPKRVTPHYDHYLALLGCYGFEDKSMPSDKKKNYLKIASELHRIGVTVECIPSLFSFVAKMAKEGNWKTWTVNSLQKYAPEFLSSLKTKNAAPPPAPVIDDELPAPTTINLPERVQW